MVVVEGLVLGGIGNTRFKWKLLFKIIPDHVYCVSNVQTLSLEKCYRRINSIAAYPTA